MYKRFLFYMKRKGWHQILEIWMKRYYIYHDYHYSVTNKFLMNRDLNIKKL